MADQTVLDEAGRSLRRLQDFDTKPLSRDELGKSYNFNEIISHMQSTLDLFKSINLLHLPSMSDNFLNIIKDQSNMVYSLLKEILEFDPGNEDNPNSKKSNIESRVISSHESVFKALHPIISYSSSLQRNFSELESSARAEIQSIRDKGEALQADLTKTSEEAAQILKDIRDIAAEHGVTQQAVYFSTESEEHLKIAGQWKIATIIMAVTTILFAILAILTHDYFMTQVQQGGTYSMVQIIIGKGIIFTILIYMLLFCSKAFASHRHNSIVNKHRQNALMTFNALTDSASNADQRDIVLIHAAACIYGPQETGYTKTSNASNSNSTPSIIGLAQGLNRTSDKLDL